jgi:hypothetical protein
MLFRHLILLLTIWGWLSFSVTSWGAIFPIKNSKPLYQIVLPAKPTQLEFQSADYLQRYVFKITGATLPIVSDNIEATDREIIIGKTTRLINTPLFKVSDTIDADGYYLRTLDKKLYILGGKNKGLFYGVIAILEKYLGCRKFSPTYEYIPKETTLEIPELSVYEKPLNTFRVVYGNFCADKEYKDWHRLHEIDDAFGEGYYVHTFWKLLPINKYFDTHPEYFALINGERSAKQLCLSNPDVYNIVLENLRNEIYRQPTRKIWSVSQNDNRYYCTCSECQKIIDEEGSPSGPIIRFVNKIAENFPDKIISTLAYTYSRHAPKKCVPAKNVQIMLCTIELNRNIPIEIDTSNRSFVYDIRDWSRITRNLYLWDYTVNFSHNISPFPNFHVLQSNLQFFNRNGVKEQFQQSNNEAGYEFSELKTYLLARLLWNPYINVDSIMKDFIKGYYGKAANYIKFYVYQLERETARSRDPLNIYGSPIWHASSFLSEKNVKYYKACFDTALNVAKGDSILTRHVEIAYLPLQYAILEIGKKDMFGPRGWFINENGRYSLRFNIKEELDKFYHTCRKYNIKTINEAGLTPKDYYFSTLRFLIPQTTDNLAYGKKVKAYPAANTDYSRGDLSMLTNGFYGTNDYTFQWIGWQGKDMELVLDLEKIEEPSEIKISSLNSPYTRAFYPNEISCFISTDGVNYRSIGKIEINNNEKIDELTRTFTFSTILSKVRYIKFKLDCTKKLPLWQTADGDASWTFIDEIVVKPKSPYN